MSEFKTIEPTNERPYGWPDYCTYSSLDFEKGSLVRIFSSYIGPKRKSIFIREGRVKNSNKVKNAYPALELLVQRSGLLAEDENHEIAVPRYNGVLVYGIPELTDDVRHNTYSYEHITLAQVQK